MALAPKYIAFVVLLTFFGVLTLLALSIAIYHWATQEDEPDIYLRDLFRGLANFKLRTIQAHSNAGTSYTFPDTTQATVIYEVPHNKRAMPVSFFLNNENGATAGDAVFGVVDANDRLYVVDRALNVGNTEIMQLDNGRLALNQGDRLLMWADEYDMFVHMDVVEFDARDDAPFRIGGQGITDLAPWSWTATHPTVITSRMFLSNADAANAVDYEVRLNDTTVLLRGNIPAAPVAESPVLVLLAFAPGSFMGLTDPHYFAHVQLALERGDVLSVVPTTAGAGPLTACMSAAELADSGKV